MDKNNDFFVYCAETPKRKQNFSYIKRGERPKSLSSPLIHVPAFRNGGKHIIHILKKRQTKSQNFLAAMSAFRNEGMAVYKKEILIIT